MIEQLIKTFDVHVYAELNLKIPSSRRVGGWGKCSCPSVTGTELIYAGRAAGTFWDKEGEGSNYLCLPGTPQYTLSYTPGSQSYSEIMEQNMNFQQLKLVITMFPVLCAMLQLVRQFLCFLLGPAAQLDGPGNT